MGLLEPVLYRRPLPPELAGSSANLAKMQSVLREANAVLGRIQKTLSNPTRETTEVDSKDFANAPKLLHDALIQVTNLGGADKHFAEMRKRSGNPTTRPAGPVG